VIGWFKLERGSHALGLHHLAIELLATVPSPKMVQSKGDCTLRAKPAADCLAFARIFAFGGEEPGSSIRLYFKESLINNNVHRLPVASGPLKRGTSQKLRATSNFINPVLKFSY
jgi:hypothetical protein